MNYSAFDRCKVFSLVMFLFAINDAMAQSAESMALTEEDCVIRALEQNLTMQARELDYDIAGLNVRRERAAFEPALVGSASEEKNSRENTVEQFRNQLTSFFEEQNRRYDVGVEGLFYSGAKYRIGYSLNDLSNNLTNSIIDEPFQNQYQNFLGVTITQPLMRGAGFSAARAGVRLAKAQRGVERQNLRREMMGVAAQTQAAFWDLVLAEELLSIRGNSVVIARDILDENRERNKQGKIAEVEVLQAEANLADRQTRENEARQQRVQVVSRLQTMFSDEIEHETADLTAKEVPPVIPFQYELPEAMEIATRFQPDYLAQLDELKQSDIRLSYAANQRWPQVDLIGSYGFNGLGDSVSDAWDEATSRDYEAWSVGVQLSVGLGGDRKASTEKKIASMRKMQALTKLKEIELTIYRALQAGIQESKALRENLNNIARVVEVREQLLDAEMQSLKAGRSDSRNVFAIEEDLLLAREAYSRSLNEYQKSILRLELTAGLTLAKRGLDIVPAVNTPKTDSSSKDVLPTDRPIRKYN
jgi:outer membrane protein